METLISQLPYQAFITFQHNGMIVSNKLIAAFYSEDDAYRYAYEVLDDYEDLGDKCVVTIKYNGRITNSLTN